MDRFEQYLESLAGSWEALAAPHRRAEVVRGDGFVGCRHPNAVFNNAVVLAPTAIEPARRLYADVESFALWCRADDAPTAAALEDAGLRRDVTTRPMRCDLGQVERPADTHAVLADVEPRRIAELNGLPPDVLADVPGARAFATTDFAAGLVLIAVGLDVNVSFVVTRPDARRRGLATAVTAAALHDAAEHGATSATLQATPMAEDLYRKLGFAIVATIQEWVPV